MTPTQRTLKAMREQGGLCAIVERFQQYGGKFGVRQDAFGFIDILAIDPTQGIVAIQSCGQAFSEHVRKMTEERNENLYEWLKHAPVELWGWRKVKLKRGGKAMRWRPRIADFYLEGEDVCWKERKQGFQQKNQCVTGHCKYCAKQVTVKPEHQGCDWYV